MSTKTTHSDSEHINQRTRTPIPIKLGRTLVRVVAGWGIFAPLSRLVPTRSNLVVCIGIHRGRYIQNIRQFFEWGDAHQKNIQLYFLTEDRKTYRDLRQSGRANVVFHPTVESLLLLLRAALIVVEDNDKWIYGLKYHLTRSTKKLQLWHGVGFKKIGSLSQAAHRQTLSVVERTILRINQHLKGRFPFYELFVTTSEFYRREVFAKSFNAGEVIPVGYPRNDLLRRARSGDFSFVETALPAERQSIAALKRFHEAGKKLILYAPTYRDKRKSGLIEQAVNWQKLATFLNRNDLVVAVKDHSRSEVVDWGGVEGSETAFYPIPKNADSYYILPFIDLLITDYSSIYMDYLHLDRPVVFFPYDFERYVSQDRPLQFDYDDLTPGPKCHSTDELIVELQRVLLDGDDTYCAQREDIRNLAFDHQEGSASKRIWDCLRVTYPNMFSPHLSETEATSATTHPENDADGHHRRMTPK